MKLILNQKVHHILAEIIQAGLVLETNVEEIDASGMSVPLPYEEFLLHHDQFVRQGKRGKSRLRPQTLFRSVGEVPGEEI